MERKTRIHADEGKNDLTITREFDLPVELLYKAHIEADIFEQWMSHEYGVTKVLRFDMKNNGAWQFQTCDLNGNVMFKAGGTIHTIVPVKKITRTFEAENSPFDVQLEFLEFEKLTEDTSKLTMHSVYRKSEFRDQMLKLPFAKGLGMAHDRLQKVLNKLK